MLTNGGFGAEIIPTLGTSSSAFSSASVDDWAAHSWGLVLPRGSALTCFQGFLPSRFAKTREWGFFLVGTQLERFGTHHHFDSATFQPGGFGDDIAFGIVGIGIWLDSRGICAMNGAVFTGEGPT